MILSGIKYGFIILCSVYITICLTNRRQDISFLRCATRICFAAIQVVLVTYTHQYSVLISILAMVFSSAFIDKKLLKLVGSTAILATVISYGTSYLLYIGGILILIVTKYLLGYHSDDISPFTFVAIGIVQSVLSILLFQTKRLRHGLPFLQNSYHSNLGAYLSISLMILAAILGIKTESHRSTVVLFFLFLSLGVLLGYWYKNYLTREYIEQMQKREQKKLEETLDAMCKENEQLRAENEIFSKLIHKDNKLIPAMELAVSQLLYSITQDKNPSSRMEHIQIILNQLKLLSEERTGIIKSYEDPNQKLPTSGLPGLDALLLFMLQKAHMSKIEFDLKLDVNIDQILTQSITELDASTLMADLIDNALIAANHNEHGKAVQVRLGIDAGIFYISVSDSGPPFPPEVLERWGIERITTHADTGGSGIGMMTIYELCQKYSASFEIRQIQNESPYHKCVSIRFDGRSGFHTR